MFIKHGNGITLSGDKLKASQFVRYAQRKLIDIKTWMRMSGSNMAQKAYFLENGCIEIVIRSIAGMDKIHIHSCAGGGCVLNVSSEDLGGGEVQLSIKYDLAGDQLTRGWTTLIRWGDGEYTFSSAGAKGSTNTQSHTYESVGEKNILVKSWNTKLLDSERSASSPTTPTGFTKHGDTLYTTEADAHANMLSKPWTIVSAATYDFAQSSGNRSRCCYFSGGSNPPPFFARRYMAEKAVLNIDLSEQENKVKMVGIVNFISPGGSLARTIGVYKNGVFHDEIAPVPNPPASSFRYLDLGDVSELTEIEIKDADGYSLVSGVANFFITNGDSHGASFFPYDCLKQKNVSITLE